MLNIAINGYGRIGRSVLRAFYESQMYHNQQPLPLAPINIVAINELADNKTIAHLTRYDSTHGRFAGKISLTEDTLRINENKIRILHEENIAQLPWQALNIDVVLECTGTFNDRTTAEQHLVAGAKKVLFRNPLIMM